MGQLTLKKKMLLNKSIPKHSTESRRLRVCRRQKLVILILIEIEGQEIKFILNTLTNLFNLEEEEEEEEEINFHHCSNIIFTHPPTLT